MVDKSKVKGLLFYMPISWHNFLKEESAKRAIAMADLIREAISDKYAADLQK